MKLSGPVAGHGQGIRDEGPTHSQLAIGLRPRGDETEGPVHLVCFDRMERKAILSRMSVRGEKPLAGSRSPVFYGTLDEHEVTLLRLPYGDDPDLLSRVVKEYLAVYKPVCVISLGSCMAFAEDLRTGDVLVTQRAIFEGASIEIPRIPAYDALMRAVPHHVRVRGATTLTVRKFVGSSEDRERLRSLYPDAEMLEMEDYHLARIFGETGTGFISLRAVTDRGDFGDHVDNLGLAIDRTLLLTRRMIRQMSLERRLAFQPNPPTSDMPYNIYVKTVGRELTLPRAIHLARTAVHCFGLGRILPDGARLDLVTCGDGEFSEWLSAPGGRAAVVETSAWVFLYAAGERYAKLILREGALDEPPGSILAGMLRHCEVREVPAKPEDPVEGCLPACRSIHVQGLNSISAEPEEGLLAATTLEEFLANGVPVVDSGAADIWIYRTANADSASYFDPPYELPMRFPGPPSSGTALIATGLGPAIDPEAPGGVSADALMLGDEQGGRLVSYLEDLCAASFRADDVFRYPGVAQRLGAESAALSRLDRRALLTQAGLNTLRFDPVTLRRIYSPVYDRFFRGYFVSRRETPARLSYLILSSRGCGNRCSICCSGGFQPFTALKPELVIGLLKRIREMAALRPGEFVDVFFLDSYFNRDPDRIVQLAAGVAAEGLGPWFEFYVRHSGLAGFLRRSAPGRRGEVRLDLVKAYRRLGIDEIVLGIDSFTDESIRLLKTDTLRLALEGEAAHPAYTFEEIEAVLTAIEAEGMASRCFLLMNNPFVGDEDRVRTYYNLAELALNLRRFRIDLESSSRVNELKPFPGAPLTRVAERIDGVIRDDRFVYRSGIGHIETWLEFERFGEYRETPVARHRFLVSFQESRALLIGRVTTLLNAGAVPAGVDITDLSRIAETILGLEARLASAVRSWLADFKDRGEAERFIRTATERLARALGTRETELIARETPSRMFFRTLHDEYSCK